MKVRVDNPTLIVYKFISFQAVCLSSLAGRTKRFTARERYLSCRNACRRPVSRSAVIVHKNVCQKVIAVSGRARGLLKLYRLNLVLYVYMNQHVFKAV